MAEPISPDHEAFVRKHLAAQLRDVAASGCELLAKLLAKIDELREERRWALLELDAARTAVDDAVAEVRALEGELGKPLDELTPKLRSAHAMAVARAEAEWR